MSIATQVFRGFGGGGNIDSVVRRGFAAYTGLPQPVASGYQYETCSAPGSGDWLGSGSSPAVLSGDIFITQTTTAPGGYGVVSNNDGTVNILCGGDNSRQMFLYSIYRLVVNAIDGPQQSWINEYPPVWGVALNLPATQNYSLLPGTPIIPIDLVAVGYVSSPQGDTMTFTLNGQLPTGVTLTSAGVVSGTPQNSGSYSGFTFTATDQAGFPATSLPGNITVSPTAQNITPPSPVVTFNNIPKARPSTRIIDDRSLVFALSGAEQPYPVYRFSGNRDKWEFPGHNPFKGL